LIQEEFYQLLDYTDDVNLKRKLAEWEHFYNVSRPHSAFKGKTPCEALRESHNSSTVRKASSDSKDGLD